MPTNHSTGCITFANGLANDLGPSHIHLSTPVSQIRQHHSHCQTITHNGRIYTSRKVIVSIPTPLYQKLHFTPPLPLSKAAIVRRTKMGYYTKVVLVYNHAWWREHNLVGSAVSAEGPVIMVMDTCVPSQAQYSLSAFVLGPKGREWSSLPKHQRMQAVKDHVKILFTDAIKPEKVPEPLNMIEKDWAKDPWFWGAPSTIYPTRILEDGGFKVIQERHGHVHFVGTETSDEFEGYMEGAVRSGERGAREVIEALRGK